jgi:hypothetical protein
MKSLFAVLVSLMLATAAHAGVVGWLTSETRDWQFIQQSGGVIQIHPPIEKDGTRVLPVDYWPKFNSGLAVRKIKLRRQGAQIVIRVVTQVVEEGSDTGRVHYVDLTGIPAGSYQVFYETAGDPAKFLGRFEIK